MTEVSEADAVAPTGDRVLGHAVFGTSHGLFASGDGILSGISNSPEAFELRDDVGAPPLGPRQMLLFRDTFVTRPDGRVIDVIGIVLGASDSARRAGFFGLCAAVAADDVAAYRDAYERVIEVWHDAQTRHLDEAGRLRDGVRPFFRPGEGDVAGRRRTYAALPEHEPLVLEAGWDDEAARVPVFELLGLTAHATAGRPVTVCIAEHRIEGSRPLDAALLAERRSEADAIRQDVARRAREREAREAEARAKAEAEAAARAEAFRRENTPTPELIARMRNQIAALEAETKALRRELAAAPSGAGPARGASLGVRGVRAHGAGRPSRRRLFVIAGGLLISALVAVIMLVLMLSLPDADDGSDVPEAMLEPEAAIGPEATAPMVSEPLFPPLAPDSDEDVSPEPPVGDASR